MRPVVFRGWDSYENKWQYGGFAEIVIEGQESDFLIIKDDMNTFKVDPDSIGQFAGISLNGVDVYEGDFIGDDELESEVTWCNIDQQFQFGMYGGASDIPCDAYVTGNFFEQERL